MTFLARTVPSYRVLSLSVPYLTVTSRLSLPDLFRSLQVRRVLLFPSRLVPSRPVPPSLKPSRPITFRSVSFCSVSFRPVLCYWIPSRPFSSSLVPSSLSYPAPLGYHTLRAPKNFIPKLRALPSFFFFRKCTLFFLEGVFFGAFKSPLVFFYTVFLLALFFLEGTFLWFFFFRNCVAISTTSHHPPVRPHLPSFPAHNLVLEIIPHKNTRGLWNSRSD